MCIYVSASKNIAYSPGLTIISCPRFNKRCLEPKHPCFRIVIPALPNLITDFPDKQTHGYKKTGKSA